MGDGAEVIRLVLEYPDGDRQHAGEVPTDGLTEDTFPDHLEAVAGLLQSMATKWRRRTAVGRQVDELFADLDTGGQAA